MEHDFKATWETYVASWKVETAKEKHDLFEQCMETSFRYNDPLVNLQGWDDLIQDMLDFHQKIPSGYFVTQYFLAHSNKSIARWEMRSGDSSVLGEGISYAEYNDQGRLISATGFFDFPEA